jgi:hypothetical protein
MKGYLLSALLLLLSVVALHPAANAEDVRVSVPFEFSAAGRLMPAGTYFADQWATLIDSHRKTHLEVRQTGSNSFYQRREDQQRNRLDHTSDICITRGFTRIQRFERKRGTVQQRTGGNTGCACGRYDVFRAYHRERQDLCGRKNGSDSIRATAVAHCGDAVNPAPAA